jgi:pyruvate formate lyase activating enzyme
VESVLKCRDIAQHNLDYVYVGNIPGMDLNTYCPNCKSLLIEREGYRTRPLINDNLCPKCNNPVNIVI